MKTNEERLKNADKFLKDLSAEGDGIGLHGQTLELVGWLIERTKLAQELERDFKLGAEQMATLVKNYNEQGSSLSTLSHDNHWLKEENKRYREALEFYADKDHYKQTEGRDAEFCYIHDVDFDSGDKARKALEATGNENSGNN